MTGSEMVDGELVDTAAKAQRENRTPLADDVVALASVAASASDAKLGQDTVVLVMNELLGVVDAFVITSGTNSRQVRAIVEEVELAVKAFSGMAPRAIEGLADGTWVLMDYGDVLVHIFLDEIRSFYDLEHLWSQAPRLAWHDHVGV